MWVSSASYLSLVLEKNKRIKFPKAEKKLLKKITKLRKVGIPVDGPYVRAKMLKYVQKDKSLDEKKVKAFKASDQWLKGFKARNDLTFRSRTNKKSRSQFKRSRMVRNFHWNMMYNLPLSYSHRKRS